jgi:hypothetical protein
MQKLKIKKHESIIHHPLPLAQICNPCALKDLKLFTALNPLTDFKALVDIKPLTPRQATLNSQLSTLNSQLK